MKRRRYRLTVNIVDDGSGEITIDTELAPAFRPDAKAKTEAEAIRDHFATIITKEVNRLAGE